MNYINANSTATTTDIRHSLASTVFSNIERINLTYFIHTSVPAETKELILNGALIWLGRELKRVLDTPIYTQFVIDPSVYTEFDYTFVANDQAERKLNDWQKLVNLYIADNKLPKSIGRKYILLTPDRLNKNTLGFARLGGSAAIASLERKKAVAHEVGHLFYADHQDAEIIQTATGPQHTNLTSSLNATDSFTYSEASQRRMRAYLGLF